MDNQRILDTLSDLERTVWSKMSAAYFDEADKDENLKYEDLSNLHKMVRECLFKWHDMTGLIQS